jgi:hypothetical protein
MPHSHGKVNSLIVVDDHGLEVQIDARTPEDQLQKLHQNLDGCWYAQVVSAADSAATDNRADIAMVTQSD